MHPEIGAAAASCLGLKLETAHGGVDNTPWTEQVK